MNNENTGPDPDWLVQLRQSSMHAASIVREAIRRSPTQVGLAKVAAPFFDVAVSQVRPLRAELDEAKRELEAAMGRHADQQTELLQALGRIRALNARLIEQDDELDKYQATVVKQAAKIARLKVEVVGLEQQGAARSPARISEVTAQHNRINKIEERTQAGLELAYEHIIDLQEERDELARQLRAITPAASPDIFPSQAPEMREVPINEVRGGDTVTVSFTAHAERAPDAIGLWLSEFEGIGAPSMFLSQEGVAITRPSVPLPKMPGSVGTATVQGRKGIRVMYAPRSDTDRSPWSSAVRVASRFFHSPEEIVDYVAELDGKEG